MALSCRRLKDVAEDALYAENRDHERSSAVDWAAKHGNIATLDKALNHGLSIEPIDEAYNDEDFPPVPDFNPLRTAVEHGQDSAVIWFLDHGADITRRIRPRCRCFIDETCILHSAICSRKASTALLLISRGAPLEYLARGEDDFEDHDVTALQEASLFGLETVVETLLRAHNMNQVFMEDFDMHLPVGAQHALSWAAMANENVPMIRKLVHLGAQVNWPPTEWESSPLHIAIANGNFAIAHALLDLGVEIRPRLLDRNNDDEGDDDSGSGHEATTFAPLHDTMAAVIDNQTPLRTIYQFSLGPRCSWESWHSMKDSFMKRLIELGVDVNMKASGEWNREMDVPTSPLELAVANGNIKYASTLLAIGASARPEMLQIAWERYHGDIEKCMKMIEPLLKYGARLDEPMRFDMTMLQFLAHETRTDPWTSGLHEILLSSSPINLAREHLDEVLARSLADMDGYTSTILYRHGARVSDKNHLFIMASSIAESLESDSRDPLLDFDEWIPHMEEMYECMRLILDMELSGEDQCLIFHDILQKEHLALAHLFLDRDIASKPEATQYLAAYLMLAASWGNVGVIKRLWQQTHEHLGRAHRLLIVYNSIIRDRREAVSFFMNHGVTPFDSLSSAQSFEASQSRYDAARKEREALKTLREGSRDAFNSLTVSRQKRKIRLAITRHGIGTNELSCLYPHMSPLQLAVQLGRMDIISDLLEYIPQNADVTAMFSNIYIPKVLQKANEIRMMLKRAVDLAFWSRKVRAKQME